MELKTITASDGMVLTNGEAFGKSITLGKNDSAKNWHEISEDEYEKMQTVINEQFESEV